MPPEYKLTVDYPSGKLISFENLRLDYRYAKVNFDKPLGMFRHEAIKHLDRDGYKKAKEDLYEALNRLIAFLGDEGEFTKEDEEKLSGLYTMMTEPPLNPLHQFLSPQSFERYIEQ